MDLEILLHLDDSNEKPSQQYFNALTIIILIL